jgi:transposase InsO family protein
LKRARRLRRLAAWRVEHLLLDAGGAFRLILHIFICTPRYLIGDRDCCYGHVFLRRVRSLGIRDHPTSARSPWQNGHAERLVGSIRRECLDHVVVFGERHLRHVLLSYMNYYNAARTHLSLGKDAPIERRVQSVGRIGAQPVLGGLHHQYARI